MESSHIFFCIYTNFKDTTRANFVQMHHRLQHSFQHLFTTDFFLWKTKGLKATGFWNAFSTCAIYGGIQKQPTIYIAAKL